MSVYNISILFMLAASTCSSFSPTTSFSRSLLPNSAISYHPNGIVPATFQRHSSRLFQSQNNDQGPGDIMKQIGIGFIILIFVASGVLPMMQGGGDRDLSIADSVVSQQDVPGKLAGFENKSDRLSRGTIQEKISVSPSSLIYIYCTSL
jgi:hypothetical protein